MLRLLLILCVISISVKSQQTTFQRAYGGTEDEVNDCLNKSIGVLTTTNTNGFAICHATISYAKPFSQGIYFLKLDKNGDTLYTRSYFSSTNISCWGRSVNQNPDSGFVLGANFNTGSWGSGPGLIRIDKNGDTLWCRRFSTPSDHYGMGYHGFRLSDNTFVSSGFIQVGNFQASLCRVNPQGNLLFGKRYSYNNDVTMFNSSFESKDHSIISIGETKSGVVGSGEILVVKTDTIGNVLWAKKYGTSDNDFGSNAVELSDKSIAIVGYKENPFGVADFDMLIIKIDSVGNLLYSKLIGTSDRQFSCSIIRDNQDNVYALGYEIVGSILYKLSPSGSLIWQKSYPKSECGNGLVLTPDGGLAFSGMTSRFGAGGWDIFLTKTDSMGYISCDTSSAYIPISDINLLSSNINLNIVSDVLSIPIPLKIRSGSIVTTNCENIVDAINSTNSSFPIFKIYPSPSANVLNIEYSERINEMFIYNSIGVLVKTIKNICSPSLVLNVEDLLEGIYFVKILAKNDVVSKKFVKIN